MTKIELEYKPDVMKAMSNNPSELFQIKREYPNKIAPYFRDKRWVGWIIEGSEEIVKKITYELIDILGIPYFASSYTDFKPLDEVLEKYNMTTKKWDVKGFFKRYPGRHVVPI